MFRVHTFEHAQKSRSPRSEFKTSQVWSHYAMDNLYREATKTTTQRWANRCGPAAPPRAPPPSGGTHSTRSPRSRWGVTNFLCDAIHRCGLGSWNGNPSCCGLWIWNERFQILEVRDSGLFSQLVKVHFEPSANNSRPLVYELVSVLCSQSHFFVGGSAANQRYIMMDLCSNNVNYIIYLLKKTLLQPTSLQ